MERKSKEVLKNSSPLVSVIMSVYNAEEYLRAAIDSVLSQSFENFEFIILNDGSTDRSQSILESYVDSRIILISRENRGLTRSLNEGLKLARGKFVARQDADDVSLPDRLKVEVGIMLQDAALGLVGTNYEIIDLSGNTVGVTDVLCHPEDLRVAEGISNQFCHGSTMFRKDLAIQLGGYDPRVGYVEDYDFFARIARISKIRNLPLAQYQWRQNPAGISLGNSVKQAAQASVICEREFLYLMSNQSRHRMFTAFHRRSVRGNLVNYLLKKSALHRDLAFLSWKLHYGRFFALHFMLMAILVVPWRVSSYRRVVDLLIARSMPAHWKFESI